LREFFGSFNRLLESIEGKMKARRVALEGFEKQYGRKILELEKLVDNYGRVRTLSKVDVQRQKNE
jgi:hypothetical protein